MIHEYEIEVVQTTTVKVTLDDSKMTPEWMADFRKTFYQFHDLEEHARHVAQLQARGLIGWDDFVEGYGTINGKGDPNDTNGAMPSLVVKEVGDDLETTLESHKTRETPTP